MFLSKKRAWSSGIVAIILVFYAFNFVPRNTNIVASRTPLVQFGDYVLNFLIFFIVAYLAISIASYLFKILTKKK